MICIGIKYCVKIELMYFERDKFSPTVEKHFLDILQEILDCDHQRGNSEQGQGQSVPTSSSDNNADFRCDHTDRQHMERPTSPKLLWLRTRGQSQCHGSFHHSTLEMSYNCHHNEHNTSPTYDSTHTSKDMSIDSAGKPCNFFGYADKRALHLEYLIDHHINGNFSHDNLYQETCNLNLAFNHQVTAPINQLRPVVREGCLLALVIVEQSTIQAAISSVEMFDGTKSKFESWTAFCIKCSTNIKVRHPMHSCLQDDRTTTHFSS